MRRYTNLVQRRGGLGLFLYWQCQAKGVSWPLVSRFTPSTLMKSNLRIYAHTEENCERWDNSFFIDYTPGISTLIFRLACESRKF